MERIRENHKVCWTRPSPGRPVPVTVKVVPRGPESGVKVTVGSEQVGSAVTVVVADVINTCLRGLIDQDLNVSPGISVQPFWP